MALRLAGGMTEQSIADQKQNLTNDPEIRRVLKDHLTSLFWADPETLILEELGLRHGATRVDIVVLNGCLHGYEVKSDRDTLKRLPRQVRMYSEILDYVTLVVGQRHADKVEQAVPQWWGVQVATHGQDGQLHLAEMRKATENPSLEKLAIAKLLWREEALAFLEELKAADGVRSKPRRFVYVRLAEIVPLVALRARVRHHLKSRTDWRSDERRMLDGG
jgi:hypothetical protein